MQNNRGGSHRIPRQRLMTTLVVHFERVARGAHLFTVITRESTRIHVLGLDVNFQTVFPAGGVGTIRAGEVSVCLLVYLTAHHGIYVLCKHLEGFHCATGLNQPYFMKI